MVEGCGQHLCTLSTEFAAKTSGSSRHCSDHQVHSSPSLDAEKSEYRVLDGVLEDGFSFADRGCVLIGFLSYKVIPISQESCHAATALDFSAPCAV